MNGRTLKNLVASFDVFAFEDYKEYLVAIYGKAKEEDGQFTYRDFTELVGLGKCNAMNLIVNGFRPLTVKTARKVADGLGLGGQARRYFITLAEATKAKQAPAQIKAVAKLVDLKKEVAPTELDKETIEFFSHWYYPAILEALRMDDARDDAEWLRDHVWPRLTLKQVNEALTFLSRSGFIAKDRKRGRLYPVADVATGRDVYGMAIVHYHQEMLDLAKASILGQDPNIRDITALTLSVPAEAFASVRDEITKFRQKLRKKFAGSTAQTVLQLNIQLFPLAAVDSDDEEQAS